ncbi:MAG: iron-containing alcohol dehydrogenase [Christensenellaceae bacterium]
MDFSFIAPGRILVRRGGFKEIGRLCKKIFRKAAVFRFGEGFAASGMEDGLKQSLDGEGIEYAIARAYSGEPTVDAVNDAAQFIATNGCDGVIAVGGGSVIDVAKAAAALAPNGRDIMEYVEGFSNRAFEKAPLPLAAVPTTAGTGSECTKNAVLMRQGEFKNSVRDDKMMPALALIDGEVMADVPAGVTATAGADAVCQLVEAYVSGSANPITDALSLPFTVRALNALPLAFENGGDIGAREEMGLCACVSGLCLANGGLGAAHGLAAAIGAVKGLKHGFLCGVLLPHVMRFNIEKGVYKYVDIAHAMGSRTTDGKQASLEMAGRIEELNKQIGMPQDLKGCGITTNDLERIAALSAASSSLKKNPCSMHEEECRALLAQLI